MLMKRYVSNDVRKDSPIGLRSDVLTLNSIICIIIILFIFHYCYYYHIIIIIIIIIIITMTLDCSLQDYLVTITVKCNQSFKPPITMVTTSGPHLVINTQSVSMVDIQPANISSVHVIIELKTVSSTKSWTQEPGFPARCYTGRFNVQIVSSAWKTEVMSCCMN